MPRGRPVGSAVRQNIVEILYYAKKVHGYGVYAMYKEIFPKVSMRAIYYHLKKGVETGEFKVVEIKKEKGNYSWGPEVERTYYGLANSAKAVGKKEVKEYLDSKGAQASQKQN